MPWKSLSPIIVLLILSWNLLLAGSPVRRTSRAQSLEVQPQIITKPIVDGKVVVLDLGLHFATTIRMPEPVSSVVVGDPTLFKVEHSEKEPRLIFVKPATPEPAESNLLISTVGGHNVSLLVRCNAESSTKTSSSPRPVHFVMNYDSASGFLIEETGQSSLLIPETVPLSRTASTEVPVRAAPIDPAPELSTTTWSRPGRSSSARKVRPWAALMPRRRKKLAEARTPKTFSAPSIPARVWNQTRKAAMSSKS
jgi:hypothetical protein